MISMVCVTDRGCCMPGFRGLKRGIVCPRLGAKRFRNAREGQQMLAFRFSSRHRRRLKMGGASAGCSDFVRRSRFVVILRLPLPCLDESGDFRRELRVRFLEKRQVLIDRSFRKHVPVIYTFAMSECPQPVKLAVEFATYDLGSFGSRLSRLRQQL